ncbi:MAG TPA: CDP-alcohol phosphatidyltransferase family protein [Acidimicrobiales bacterium]|nr:CDP-alcohol phosphatidyltransferase family protein [Acidimicrobiales bacterium]
MNHERGERSGEEHVSEWAQLHRTDTPTGFVAGWLRASAAVARPLARAGISPNTVTVVACLTGIAAVPLAMIDGWPGPAAACLAVVISGMLDSLDGAVAVQAGRATKVGFLLDSALDRLADAAFPVALAIVAGSGAWVAVGAVAACWWMEYIRARASLADATGQAVVDRQSPGHQLITPGERPTRIVLTAFGLGIPPLALAALWGHVVIVGGSAVLLLVHSLVRLHRRDRGASPPSPTT